MGGQGDIVHHRMELQKCAPLSVHGSASPWHKS
jgi:hypothetical protein